MDVNPIRHNLHCLSLHSIGTGIPLYPEPPEHVDLASLLKLESVSGFLTLPGHDPMPCGLYDRTAFPVLEAVVCGDTEVDAPRVSEILDVDTSDCACYGRNLTTRG